MSRRSRPPRKTKSRTPEAPQQRDIAVGIPPEDHPAQNPVREAREASSSMAPAEDAELAELDAGWD